jgi:hypothetical protein
MATLGIEPSLIREQVHRLVHSDVLRNSETQRRLLTYLAEKSIAGEADQLKEYTVGLDILGKPGTYDPRKDCAARMQSGKLRQKIREYYQTEGAADPIRIDLPKGRFKLTFELREAVRATADTVAPRSKQDWLVAALGITLVMAVSLAAYWGIRLKRVEERNAEAAQKWTPELEAIWQPFLTNSRPVVICIGTPLFLTLSPKQGPQVYVRSAVINDLEDATNSQLVETLKKVLQSAEIAPTYNFTGIGEASGAFQLATLLGTRRRDLLLKRSSTINWDEISRNNVIFVGPPKFNPQLKEMPVEQELVMDSHSIRNLRPQPGEPTWGFRRS